MWIVSNYSFMFSLPLAALSGHRGLTPARPLANQLAYAGNMTGIGASLAGGAVLLYAAFKSL